MPRKSGPDALLGKARFVFKGRVMKLGASNARLLPSSEKTAVVRVENIYRANDSMRGLLGRDVTVVLKKKATGDEAGQSIVFFTNGFLFGNTVAVQELDRRHPSEQTDRIIGKIPEFERKEASSPLAERVASAEAVVVGRVTALRSASAEQKFRSEHDPDWWVATVEVVSPVRGKKVEKELEVLFANSRDISWHASPKFRAGESGVISLRKERVKGVGGEFYVATHPLDLLPLDRLQEVKDALKRRK